MGYALKKSWLRCRLVPVPPIFIGVAEPLALPVSPMCHCVSLCVRVRPVRPCAFLCVPVRALCVPVHPCASLFVPVHTCVSLCVSACPCYVFLCVLHTFSHHYVCSVWAGTAGEASRAAAGAAGG